MSKNCSQNSEFIDVDNGKFGEMANLCTGTTYSKKDYNCSFIYLLMAVIISISLAYFSPVLEQNGTYLILSGFLFIIFWPWHIAEVYRFCRMKEKAFSYFTRLFFFIIVSSSTLGWVLRSLPGIESKLLIPGFTVGALFGLIIIIDRNKNYKKVN